MGYKNLANFEGLIRQALERQNAADPAVREKVYEASRTALARMIANGGPQPPAAIERQRTALENCIDRIEFSYLGDVPRQVRGDTGNSATARRETPHAASNDDFPHDEGTTTPGSPPPDRRKMLVMVTFIPLFAVIGLLIYWLVATVGNSGAGFLAIRGELTENDRNAFLTILSPVNTGTLRTAGRGMAEIVNRSNLQMIRLTSLRRQNYLDIPADPILVGLPSGVIEQIAGRRITVEILARSAGPAPATFAVHCNLGGIDACGKKRYRVGLEPEEIVFTIDVPADLSEDDSYFGINTDISGPARMTGRGYPIDIHYARLRMPE